MTKVYMLLALMIGSVTFAQAQKANAYRFYTKSDVALEDMTSSTTLLAPDTNPEFNEYTSPATDLTFNFTFAGVVYNSFTANSNGVVALGSTPYTSANVIDNYLSESNTFPILVPYGVFSLTGTDGGIKYKITGAPGSRKVTVDYFIKTGEDINTKIANKHFQVWLFEGSNIVQFVYGQGVGFSFDDFDLGIASATNETMRVSLANHAVTASKLEEDFGWPGAGRSYLFSPTEIVAPPVKPAEPVEVVTPVVANVSMSPEYFVEGQQKYTIYLGYGVQSATLKASDVSGGVAGNTAYTYVWSANKGSISSTASSVVVSPTVSTLYTVTISDAKGNKVSKQIAVYVIDVRCANGKIAVCRNGKLKPADPKHVQDMLEKDKATLGYCNVAASSVEVEPESDITTYPNPSVGLFSVDLKNYFSSIADIYVISDLGEVVSTQSFKMTTTAKKISFDLTKQHKGWYYVTVAATDCIKTFRILVQ